MASLNVTAELIAIRAQIDSNAGDLNTAWVLICGMIVFFMQGGFSILEAGSVRKLNVANILLKNVLDVCVAAIMFFLVGFAFAYGDTAPGGEIASNAILGHRYFALVGIPSETFDYTAWFFQFAFAATASTIISGSMAGRTRMRGYLTYTILVSGFVYPVVVHWVWSGDGWLGAFNSTSPLFGGNGMIDFAGSSVVHMLGGFAAVTGAVFLGPREDRRRKFERGDLSPIRGHSTVLQALGVIMLFFSWFAFNCGSTLAIVGLSGVAGLVAVNTVLAGASSAICVLFFNKIVNERYLLVETLNGLLSGLVGITAGCSVVSPWAAIIIGFLSGPIMIGGSRLLARLHIDDPLDAWPVHGLAGAWGTLAVGLFADPALMTAAGYSTRGGYGGLITGGGGLQFGTQLVGVLAIIGWTCALSAMMFALLKAAKALRVSPESEALGLDVAHHDGKGYNEDYSLDEIRSMLTRHYGLTDIAGDWQTEIPLKTV